MAILQDAEMKLVCKPEFPSYSAAACAATCLVSLHAPALEDTNRAPVSVTLVLDRSGSMAGSKLALVKETCKFLLQQLGARDSVSKDHELVTARVQNRESVAAAIDRIKPGSTTNLSGGLFMGLTEQLNAAANPAPPSAEDWVVTSAPSPAIHSVFLFTDGQANQGVTNVHGITTAMANMLAAHGQSGAEDKLHAPAQVKVHTFGFGADHNSEMLQGIAECANGTYYFIESQENIPETFADALGGLLSVYAQNVELTIAPVATNTISEVHTGVRKRVNGASTIVTLADVFAEERKDVVVDLALSPATQHGAYDALKATVSFVNVVGGQLVSKEAVLTLQRVETVPEGMVAEEEVVLHRARLSVASGLRQAVTLADSGRYEEADSVLAERIADLDNLMVQEATDDEDSVAGAAAPARAMYAALRQDVHRTRRQVQRPDQWSNGGRHYTLAQAGSHAVQRSNGAGYTAKKMSAGPSVMHRMCPPAPPTGMGVPTSKAQKAGIFGRLRGAVGFASKTANPTGGMPPPAPQASMSALCTTFGAPQAAAASTFGGAPPAGDSFGAGSSAMPDDEDEDEIFEAANMYANTRQRTLVRQTKDAVEK